MRAEYVNPFLASVSSIFERMANVELTRVGLRLKELPVSTKDITIEIGLIGELKGHVSIGLDEDVAISIVSNMMGFKVTTLDDVGKSALSEITNIFMGQVSTQFESMGKKTDITPPALVRGKNIEISPTNIPMLSVLYNSKYGDVEFDVSVA